MLNNLIEKLKPVKDFRKNPGKRYPLYLVLVIIILGIMEGHVSYRALGDFSQNKKEIILKMLRMNLDNTPDYSTIRRVMIGVNWQELLKIFNVWADEEYGDRDDINYLSMDGKSLRSTVIEYDNEKQNFIVFVSLFSQETGLVLHLKQFENKEGSEIEQFRDTVRDCQLENKIFMGDALHCQKKTISEIISTNNDYIFQVKANQKNLYKELKKIAEINQPLSCDVELDVSHGRKILRKVSVFEKTGSKTNNWEELKSVIKVERSGERGNKPYEEVAYYISSCQKDAQEFSEKIRGYWKIENQLHWVKDVVLEEDTNGISDFQPATNLSILKTIGINLLRNLGFLSITEGQRWLASRWERLTILYL
jgi:predicted transposase YbfD/YdcC